MRKNYFNSIFFLESLVTSSGYPSCFTSNKDSIVLGFYNQRLSRACIVHLVIKKTNWCYVKTMSCSGSHLGITINIKNTKFVKDLPMIDA
jgi:hypothetical protein